MRTKTRYWPPRRTPSRREKPEYAVPPLRVTQPASVTHWPREPSFWIANSAPSRAGRIVPEKRTRRPRLTLVLLTLVFTRTATATVAIGLVTLPSVVWTRSCVVCASAAGPNETPPLASVTTALPRVAKAAVYGNARCCRRTCLPALPVPVSWPPRLAPPPKVIGFGVAAKARPRGCFLVVTARSAPLVTPLGFEATRR